MKTARTPLHFRQNREGGIGINADAVKKIDFLSLAPYVRYIHENSNPDTNKVPPRIIYDHEIIFYTKGEGIYRLEDREYILRPSDLHFIRPHIPNSSLVLTDKPFHYYAVHFDLLYLGEDLEFSPDEVYVNIDYNRLDYVPLHDELAHRPTFELSEVAFPAVIHAREPQKYEQLFRQLLKAFQEKAYGYHLEMRGVLLLILKLMVEDSATNEGINRQHPHQDKIATVIHYLYEHYDKELDISQLALSTHFSPNHFRALFKAATGKTILEFLTEIRMEKAKEYLLTGGYSLLEICRMIGYEDIHYFSRLFKKREGLSPKHYVNSLIGKTRY